MRTFLDKYQKRQRTWIWRINHVWCKHSITPSLADSRGFYSRKYWVITSSFSSIGFISVELGLNWVGYGGLTVTVSERSKVEFLLRRSSSEDSRLFQFTAGTQNLMKNPWPLQLWSYLWSSTIQQLWVVQELTRCWLDRGGGHLGDAFCGHCCCCCQARKTVGRSWKTDTPESLLKKPGSPVKGRDLASVFFAAHLSHVEVFALTRWFQVLKSDRSVEALL